MLSAAARAISTRSPSLIDPEASSTKVTLSGVASSSSGAWKPMRAMCIRSSSGWRNTSLTMVKLPPSSGWSYW